MKTHTTFGLLLTVLLPQVGMAQTLSRYEFSERHMAVDVRITLYAAGETTANDAARKAFARIADLERVFSDFDPASEAMRLCRQAQPGEFTPVSNDLYTVLEAALELAQRTDGAFDVTVGPLSKLWRRARRQKVLPDPTLLAEARSRTGYRLVQIDRSNHSVRLGTRGMQFDFGGIAKGYAAQEALAVLKTAGISSALVAVAGDLAAGDPPPDAPGWKVGVVLGSRTESEFPRWLKLSQAAVSTSGDTYQYVVIDGTRYAHIVDPRTGVGLTDLCSVTVIAPNGLMADSLATASLVMGPVRGGELLRHTPGIAALLARELESHVTVHTIGDVQRWLWPATIDGSGSP